MKSLKPQKIDDKLTLELDADGYPTDEALNKIRDYPITNDNDCLELLQAIKSVWTYDHYWVAQVIYPEDDQDGATLFQISTGGWSGNEDLIGAMQRNTMFWMLSWESSRRGGHYEFLVRAVDNE